MKQRIHTSEMLADGGRDGRVEAAGDADLTVQLSTRDDSKAVTPEHLFAGAYAACYLEALKHALEKSHLSAEGVTVIARVHLDETESGDYQLTVELRASLPGLSESEGKHIMNLAHQSCPYSRATRGHARVDLEFD